MRGRATTCKRSQDFYRRKEPPQRKNSLSLFKLLFPSKCKQTRLPHPVAHPSNTSYTITSHRGIRILCYKRKDSYENTLTGDPAVDPGQTHLLHHHPVQNEFVNKNHTNSRVRVLVVDFSFREHSLTFWSPPPNFFHPLHVMLLFTVLLILFPSGDAKQTVS